MDALITQVGDLAAAHGEGWLQAGELLLAFGLSSLVGFERQIRGKSAGLRTQSIVGTTAALIVLISKYGFADVLSPGHVVLDPSRVAAQIVTGVGFLGAGLILTRQGSVRGLTTAAAVWETAAIGMAAGAGLPILAALVTALHFVAVFGFTYLLRWLPRGRPVALRLRVRYVDGRGALRQVLTGCTSAGWTIADATPGDSTDEEDHGQVRRTVSVTLGLNGSGRREHLLSDVAELDDVVDVELLSDEDIE